MRDYLDVAVEAAKIGGEVLRQYYGKAKEIEYKAEIDLVTQVDKRSEKLIVEWLYSRFPHHSILAEEGTEMQRSDEFKWVIDPLDGTTNYAHDYPLFGVSVAIGTEQRADRRVLFTIPLAKNYLSRKRGMELI